MRLNKFIAQHTELSRRGADEATNDGRIKLNGQVARPGDAVEEGDTVLLDNILVKAQKQAAVTLLFHKPPGYVCSKDGQGSATVYELLPKQYHDLNIAGRLDKDSSGLIVLSNDGTLIQQLTHPSKSKHKIYHVLLTKPLLDGHRKIIEGKGVDIGDDRLSKLTLSPLASNNKSWQITMNEGRNRQIRRTFNTLGYGVKKLHRIQIGPYELKDLSPMKYSKLQLQ